MAQLPVQSVRVAVMVTTSAGFTVTVPLLAMAVAVPPLRMYCTLLTPLLAPVGYFTVRV